MPMNKPTWKTYALGILLTEAVGALAGWLVRDGTKLYQNTIQTPPFSPPAIVFPIAWVLLYALMGIGAARVYATAASHRRTVALEVYLLQLAFNFFWSILFFNFQAFGFALLWLLVLWGLILVMIRVFYPLDRPAALMQIPYLLWVTFAAYLNFGVWLLN